MIRYFEFVFAQQPFLRPFEKFKLILAEIFVVNDLFAASTHEVMMVPFTFDFPRQFVLRLAPAEVQLENEADIGEEVESSIDGSEANIRVDFMNLKIDVFSG
jgi:hypothetical protein